MKLSEAMREGAKLRPQGFGGLFMNYPNDITSCAIGAAFEADTGLISPSDGKFKEWASERGLTRIMTGGGLGLNDLYEQIVQLNDYSRMTREVIADWLEEQGL